jgi:hypothetical protein
MPEGSNRQYKRGHKANPRPVISDEEYTEVPIDETEGEPEPLTLDAAAAMTPDDKPPGDTAQGKVRTEIRVTARVRRDVEGKVAFLLAIMGQGLTMADPICGAAIQDHSANVANKLTPVICQSPDVVKWFTRSGNFIMWLDLIMALWPVLAIVYAHHIARSIVAGVPSPNGQVQPDMYVVQ